MRKLLLPFLLPVAGFVAVKGYYWFQVNSAADQLVQSLSPFAVVEYDGIVAQFDGVAGMTGLRILPHGWDVPVEIRAATIEAPSWTDFLKIRDQSELPHRLAVSLQGLKLDSGSSFFNLVNASVGGTPVLLGCPNAPGLGDLMPEWGYQDLEADLELAYVFNPSSEYLSLEIEASADGHSSLQVSTEFDLGDAQLSQSTLSDASPRFGGVQLTYRDDSFLERRNRYCADLNGEEVPAFIDRHVALLAEHYRASGFVFGLPLEAAYREFVAGGADFSLTLHAPEPLPVTTLLLSSPQDLLQAMDVSIAVNGERVEPLELSWAPPQPRTESRSEALAKAPAAAQAEVQEAVVERAAAKPDVQPAPRRIDAAAVQEPASAQRPSFRPVVVTAIGDHLGRRLRILTHNGREIEGVLVSGGRNGLRLRQQLEMGEAELPITFARIDSIEAFY